MDKSQIGENSTQLDRIQDSNQRWDRDVDAHFAMSIAYSRLGEQDKAAISFESANAILDRHKPDFESEAMSVSAWLHCQPLRREAESLIQCRLEE